MLRSIQLENFKAFGQRTVIPLAPITLIFGQNSAGKSSILQALSLLKQTVEQGGDDTVLLLRVDKGFVDLGSFQDVLFRHDMQRELVIRLDMDTVQTRGARRDKPHEGAQGIGIQWRFSRPTLSEEISVKQLTVFPECSDDVLADFVGVGPVPVPFKFHFGIYPEEDSLAGKRVAPGVRCVRLTRDPRYWSDAFNSVKANIDIVLKTLKRAQSLVAQRLKAPSAAATDTPDFSGPWEETLGTFTSAKPFGDAIRFFRSDFDLKTFVDRLGVTREGSTYSLNKLFVGGLSSQSDRQPTAEDYLFESLADFGNETLDYGCSAFMLASQAKVSTESTLRQLFPLGPYRQAPERFYIFTGTNPKNVGVRGQLLPELLFRNSDFVTNTNQWLRRLETGYEIEVRTLGPTLKDLFEIRLRDVKQQPPVEVGLLDVGFGVSQLLPLIVQSLASTDQIITVEQPEVHIHPKLQADLGDLLIEAIKEPRRNQFIIETHSEHMALRLQRRVREKKLPPKAVSVVYVSRGPNGSTVQPLRLDEEGDFVDDFPGGFFPERLRELR